MQESLNMCTLAEAVRESGWAATPAIISPGALDALTRAPMPLLSTDHARGGVWHLLDVPSVRDLARSEPVRAVAEAVLGPRCVAARGILFGKTAGAN